MEGKKRILEVGPGIRPMHHRSQDGLVLGPDEEYTALDQSLQPLDQPEWQKAKELFGDRAHFVQGDRADMTTIADNSIDELVALGTHVNEWKVLVEFHRVLKPGGLLRLGGRSTDLPELMSAWGVRLQRMGYTERPEEKKEYDYFPTAEVSRPYVVVTFEKGKIE